MKTLLICLSLLLSWVAPAFSADALADFDTAMAGNDSAAKKKAIRGLNNVSDDEAVYDRLVKALGDRQSRKSAVKALRSRSGLSPSEAGYPTDDKVEAWAQWLNKKKEAKKAKAKIAALEKKAKEAEEAKKKEDQVTATDELSQDAAVAEQSQAKDPFDGNYGRLDRIHFRDGTLLRCYILSKRTDLDGNLTSLVIMHRGGAGKEVLNANLVARIEEDVN